MKFKIGVLAICLAGFCQASNVYTDAEVVQRIIQNSIAGYSESCACPYNYARNGSRCGKRSAYSRGGGATPLCYDSDVTPDMVQQYRNTH